MGFDFSIFLRQHALYLLMMTSVQIALGTAAHWATKERGWDDTWIGAIGLGIVFGIPPVVLWLAGLDARVPAAMFAQAIVVVGIVKFTDWTRRRGIVDLALFVVQTLSCVSPAFFLIWLILEPIALESLVESLAFVVVSIVVVGLTTLLWDWHHHTIQGFSPRRRKRIRDPEQVEDIKYALERQAELLVELMNSNGALDKLAADLRHQQEIISRNLEQLDGWRRIGRQTLEDILRGVSSCYVIRESREKENGGGEGKEEAEPFLRVIGGRNGKD